MQLKGVSNMPENPPAPAPITPEAVGALQGDAFRALLPAEISAKPYMKDVNTFGDFVKKFDGAQSLLGQRTIPDDKSDPAAWKDFHSKVAPKTAEEYKFPDAIEGLDPAFVKNAAESKAIRPLLLAAGLSNYQANILLPGFLKMIKGAEAAETTRKDTEFAKLSTDLFGGNKEAIVTNAKKFMATHIPENVRPLLEGMDEKQLTVLLAVTDGMAKKFTGEDPFRGTGAAGGGGGAETKDQLVAQMQAIMREPAYNDPFKDKVKNKELNDKMEVIRGKLKKLQSGA
jgi:hypothetical protein